MCGRELLLQNWKTDGAKCILVMVKKQTNMNAKQLGIKFAQLSVVLMLVFSVQRMLHIDSSPKTGAEQTVSNQEDSKSAKKAAEDPEERPRSVEVVAKNAPKQAEVTKKVSKEKRYYLLATANDTLYADQWSLSNVNVSSAWDITANSDDVTVAVLDSGFALAHEDLTNQWFTNAGEVGGGKETNGIDDDGNGYVDDWRGWDFYSVDNSPQTGVSNPTGDGVEHGTEVAGLVGATTNNNLGVASVSGGATLMPLQVISDNGSGYSSDIAAAIYYATDNGADVINMSLGTSGDDTAVRNAVDYAVDRDVVVVAAAGNCGNNDQDVCSGQVSGYVTFPANYDRVVAVGALGQSNSRASFSSYGQRVDIAAPGSGSFRSTSWSAGNATSLYATNLYGTSFSSPITAGAAALIRSIRPDSSVDDVRALLMASANKVSGMSGEVYTKYYGHGLLNVGQSIQIANDLNGITEDAPTLYQAGNAKAEKNYRTSDALGSGCEIASGTWCTVWLRNTTENYDRFLPYQKTDVNDEAGWTWGGSILQHGEWSIRARQGDTVSTTPVLIFSK